MPRINLGVIGYGTQIKKIIHKVLQLEPDCRLVAVADVRIEEIRAEFKQKGVTDIVFFHTPEEMLEGIPLDGVFIGTRCSLHATMALKVLAKGLPLYLEKPVATSLEDLLRLKRMYESSGSHVVVSFPLRVIPLIRLAKEIIASGKVGTIEHVQAVNNVPYGGVYYQNWYRDENETGGLFLQKATHDLDYINYLLDAKPLMVCAMSSKQIFKGKKPAGLKCVDCGEQHVCLESYTLKKKKNIATVGDMCCFAVDTGNEDSGSVIIQYESGMHVSYSQNFHARREAATRGATLIGYKGTVQFDYYKSELKVYMHHKNEVGTYQVKPEDDGHGGGDTVLAQNFIHVIKGEAASLSPLEAGLLSALMCLKARESARTNSFQHISWNS